MIAGSFMIGLERLFSGDVSSIAMWRQTSLIDRLIELDNAKQSCRPR